MVRRAPLVSAVVILTMLGVAALTFGMSTRNSPSPGNVRCADPDMSVPNPYPISGYWVFPRKDRCGWRTALEAIHRVGGDTLIQFGPRLEPRRIGRTGQVLDDSGAVDPAFTDCVDGGKTCYQAARDALRAAHPANAIVQTYAYRSTEPFGGALAVCPEMDGRLVVGSRVYYRLLLPADAPGDETCDFGKGRQYRLILVAGSTNDSVGMMLDEADRFGMSAFVGLPTSPSDPVHKWTASLAHSDTLVAFTRRVLRSYAERYGGHASFRGFYQTFEIQLRRWRNPARATTLQVYAAQHAVVDDVLPAKDILISPYWDARRLVGSGTPPDQVRAGFMNAAATGVDIIAPQDSRGTGKAAPFWDHEAAQPVDRRLHPVFGVGDTTYDKAYYAPVRDYYRAAAQARDRLAERGQHVELWATLEAFEPTGQPRCAPFTSRGRTDKARLDGALTAAGPYPSKVISFMWDGLYTCRAGRPASLAEEIAGDWDRPIVTQAFLSTRSGRDGLIVRGYRLDAGTVTLTWQGSGTRRLTVPGGGRYDPAAGRRNPKQPERMEELWVPLPKDRLRDARQVRIDLTNGSGKRTLRPYPLLLPWP
ncbi:MAG: DUF4434 domain-containing protein [Streptosporangiales bacterium]|nr:DUF4434 domain-containing protein [Streptosporangiales bacterium]